MVTGDSSPGLGSLPVNSADLLSFMERELAVLEEAQGGVDKEAREKLEQLRQQILALSEASQRQQVGQGGAAPVDELEVARKLDSVEAKLQSLEAELSSTDEATQALLTRGTAVWLSQQNK
ncbi:hypothetical protein WJX72_002489 [[Myrmecia] bisecta]|uniref:Uncharacterized protein n=1 Tax=[Myrmecia] bisecta TaxID=41462 RepID=A0AAW1QPM9_9CHLO